MFFRDNFESGNGAGWTVSHEGTPDFTERDWSVVSDLPDEREGSAFFGPNPSTGMCSPGGDESAVLHLDSPLIDVSGGQTGFRMAFDHWIATEPGWDGGNVKLSVNGKPWLLIKPEHYVYSAYNTTLVAADQGNTDPLAGTSTGSGSTNAADRCRSRLTGLVTSRGRPPGALIFPGSLLQSGLMGPEALLAARFCGA